VALVVTCPQCNRQLSLKADFAGKMVLCPSCKSTFLAPADEGEGPAADLPAAASASSGMDFLDDMPRTSSRASTSTASFTGKTAPKGTTFAKTSGLPGRLKAKKKKEPIELYIAGGVGGAIVLFAIVIYMMVASPSASSAKKNVKYGLSESQRRELFYELIESVDNLGVSDNCRQNWQRIEAKFGVDSATTGKILNEGFIAGSWREPDFPAGTAAARANRKGWIAARGLDGSGDPLLNP
jgi:hypothetical protein